MEQQKYKVKFEAQVTLTGTFELMDESGNHLFSKANAILKNLINTDNCNIGLNIESGNPNNITKIKTEEKVFIVNADQINL